MTLNPLRHHGVACLAAVLLFAAASPLARAADDLSATIGRVMDTSAKAWSAGDLDGFMDSYEDSPDTVFVGSAGPVLGKPAIRAVYAPRFEKAKPGELGALTFDTLQLRPLGEQYALLVGRFHLRPKDAAQPEATGIFTLTFHRRNGRWRIVSDHTS